MAVTAPPTTVQVNWADVPGESDEIFHTFFNSNPRAALLACDRVGVTSLELTYRSKANWDAAVRAASHLRPVQKSVDLAALSQLRYNMQERHRQHLFRELYAVRQQIIERGDVDMLWAERQRLIETSDGLREQLEDPPIEIDPLADDELLKEVASTPAQPLSPAGDNALTPSHGQRQPSGASRHSRRASTISGPKPPPAFPKQPAPPPICKFRNFAVLERDEAYIESARRSLHEFTKQQAAAERAFRKHQLLESAKSGSPPSPPKTARATSMAIRANVQPLSHSLLSSVMSAKSLASEESVTLPVLPESSRPRVKTAEKEFAALVRATMGKVSQEAIADLQLQTLLQESEQDRRQVAQAQISLRRRACSPAAHSATRSSARRPSTDGHPSDEVARIRLEKAKHEEMIRAERFEDVARDREDRAEFVKEVTRNKAILLSQTTHTKQTFVQRNRDRVLRAAEAQRLAEFEAKERRRMKAAEVHEKRKEIAMAQRQQHYELQELRRKFADAVEKMAIQSQWEVPDELRGLIAAFDKSETPSSKSGP